MKVLFHIFGFPVHFFGVMIGLGFVAAVFVAYLEVKRKGLDVEKLFDIALYSIISAVVGARIFYIVFYDFNYYISNPIEIIKINEGGLSIHGGLAGAFIFAIIYFRKHKLSFFKYADASAPGIILAQGIGRVGCDVFGKVMTTALPWGIYRNGQVLHPTQVYEFILNYIVFFMLWRKRKKIDYNGQLFLRYIILFSINRSIVELFRINPSIAGWFSISHLLSILFIIGALVVRYLIKKGAPQVLGDDLSTAMDSDKTIIRDILILAGLAAVSIFIFYLVQS